MVKTIAKETGIVILLLIAVALVMGILFYDYVPTNKTVPAKIEEYTLPQEVKTELEESMKQEEQNIVRTYYIDSIGKSNDSNYLYITVHEFQVEGTFTLKLSRLISEKLEVGKSYEFTFKVDNKNINVTTDKLFNNGEVLNIEYTDKEGLDRISKSYCKER